MSAVAEAAGLVADWERLERSAEHAAHALAAWRARAREAEDEVERLRQSLEELAAGRDGPGADLAQEMKRLKAENVALRSRMLQTRKRVAALMQRLAALEVADG
jgi:hypothetical protein